MNYRNALRGVCRGSPPGTDEAGEKGKFVTAYIIEVSNIKTGARRVSQEGYDTIEKALDSIDGRSGFKIKVNEHKFIDYEHDTAYIIHPVRII